MIVRSLVRPLLLTLALSTGSAPIVHAAPPAKSDIDKARDVYEQGRQAFEVSNFLDAIKRFEEAYSLSKRTEILWNIATSYHRQYEVSGDLVYLRRARLVYSNYAQVAGAQSERDEGRREADRAQAELDKAAAAAAAPPTVAPPSQAPPPAPPPVAVAPTPAPVLAPVAAPATPPPSDARPASHRGLYAGLIIGAVVIVAAGAVAIGLAASSSGPTLPMTNGGRYMPFGPLVF